MTPFLSFPQLMQNRWPFAPQLGATLDPGIGKHTHWLAGRWPARKWSLNKTHAGLVSVEKRARVAGYHGRGARELCLRHGQRGLSPSTGTDGNKTAMVPTEYRSLNPLGCGVAGCSEAVVDPCENVKSTGAKDAARVNGEKLLIYSEPWFGRRLLFSIF